MLYLAEVIQKKGGIIGGGKSELKLLACQRSEQNWSAIATEEIIPAEEASRFGPGTLLLVDLTANKQVQRVQEAGRPLVSILQTFSRLQEKFKTQEEEIEQWKQSLTYQSQELNRREMEMEARSEQLQAIEQEAEQLEQQRQQFEATREEVERQKAELERNRQELEGAWKQLQGQKQQIEERQAELLGAAVLDEVKAQALYQLLDQAFHSGDAIYLQESINQTRQLLNQQQDVLNHHWHQLEQHRQTVQQMNQEIDRHIQTLDEQWQLWHQAQESLEQSQIELKVQQSILQTKQEYAEVLGNQMQYQDDLHQQLSRIAEGAAAAGTNSQINTEALEAMPLNQLQELILTIQREFNQSSQFVNGQEEELEIKEQEIEALRSKIAQVSEGDRSSLETELADELDAYQFLNETLVGQRRSLREKEGILRQHKAVLARRQGKPAPEAEPSWSAVFSQIEAQRQTQFEEHQKIEAQIEEICTAIEHAQAAIDAQTAEQEAKRTEINQLEEALKLQKAAITELAGKVALYELWLQPVQDLINAMQQQLEGVSFSIAQSQESDQSQQQAIDEIRQIITELTQKPELAFS